MGSGGILFSIVDPSQNILVIGPACYQLSKSNLGCYVLVASSTIDTNTNCNRILGKGQTTKWHLCNKAAVKTALNNVLKIYAGPAKKCSLDNNNINYIFTVVDHIRIKAIL